MKNSKDKRGKEKGTTIFRSVFRPLFFIMLLQALIFYFAAVYGGIEDSLRQNASDILCERLDNRKYEIQTQFNGKWTKLDDCAKALNALYAQYEASGGERPFVGDAKRQIAFLKDSAATLIGTLRHNEVNGVFLILNDQVEKVGFPVTGEDTKYGLCIRDMDPDSNYTGTEDLLLERAPSSIVDALGCMLDSWWEPKYRFASAEAGDFYYAPLLAAWDNAGVDGDDLAYCALPHNLSDSDPSVLTYSIPLLAADGAPYGVLGIEMTTRRLATLLPSRELNDADKSCYVLAMQLAGSTDCVPIVGTGSMYSRLFQPNETISRADVAEAGGFRVTGRGGVALYGAAAALDIYNNNNPFEARQLTLLAMVESATLFEYIGHVKTTLLAVSALSLLLGVAGIGLVSKRFAAPITRLAERVRKTRSKEDAKLEHIGVTEIDQLVDSIEELNRNVNRNSARTEFFSRMSHDMRTPMNAIISFSSEELLDGASEATKDDYLQKIHASGELLLALINEVLDMTKIESNKTELRLEPIRADRLCEAVVPIITELAQKKDVLFTACVATDPGTYVLADKQHMNQIVMNLLSNAVKFTSEGGAVRLNVSREVSDDPDSLLCRIVVADTGVGMSESFLKRLYTPFEQEGGNGSGTGLGLSIAKKLIDLMHGAIDCRSKLGEGTTFTVTLPLALCDAPADRAEAAVASDEGDVATLLGKRVLVCEDNAVNTLIIVKVLENKGMTVTLTRNGLEGVNAFAASAPDAFDAVLMDIRMPELDGLEATRRIRALPREDARRVPIIAMTANAFEEDARASAAAGMNAHLAKPLQPSVLYATLARLLAEQGRRSA